MGTALEYSFVVFLVINDILTFSLFGEESVFGGLEGGGELTLEGVEGNSSGSLGLSGGLSGSLGSGGSVLVSLLLSLLFGGSSDGVVGVKFVHETLVLEGVLLLLVVENLVGSDLSELGLDLVAVDDSSEVSAVHDVSVEDVAALLNTLGSVVAEDVVEGSEGLSSPDDESTEVTTWGELEEVHSVNVDGLNTGEVSSGSLDLGVVVTVNDEGTLSENVSGVSHLTLADSNLLGGSGSSQVVTETEVGEGGEESLGGLSVQVLDNEGELWDVVDSVTSGEDEGSNSGGSESGSDGVSLLLEVDLSVPSSVGLEGSEHSTLSALVTEGSLT